MTKESAIVVPCIIAKHIAVTALPSKYDESIFTIRTTKPISIDTGRRITLNTGVTILLSEAMNRLKQTASTRELTIFAHVGSLPELVKTCGVLVYGPNILPASYTDELYVILENTGNSVFNAKPGTAIALLWFSFAPKINLDFRYISD